MIIFPIRYSSIATHKSFVKIYIISSTKYLFIVREANQKMGLTAHFEESSKIQEPQAGLYRGGRGGGGGGLIKTHAKFHICLLELHFSTHIG